MRVWCGVCCGVVGCGVSVNVVWCGVCVMWVCVWCGVFGAYVCVAGVSCVGGVCRVVWCV